GLEYAEDEPPLPSQETYTAVISGFLTMNDTATALTWFDRLLEHSLPPSPIKPFSSVHEPPRPSNSAWFDLMGKLIDTPGKDSVDHLNRYWKILREVPKKDGISL